MTTVGETQSPRLRGVPRSGRASRSGRKSRAECRSRRVHLSSRRVKKDNPDAQTRSGKTCGVDCADSPHPSQLTPISPNLTPFGRSASHFHSSPPAPSLPTAMHWTTSGWYLRQVEPLQVSCGTGGRRREAVRRFEWSVSAVSDETARKSVSLVSDLRRAYAPVRLCCVATGDEARERREKGRTRNPLRPCRYHRKSP